MERITVIVLFIAAFAGVESFSLKPSSDKQNEVEIIHFHWPSDAALMGRIPDKESFYFKHAEVDILPQNFTDQFAKCISIIFYGKLVRTIHISPKLTNIELGFTSTENVIIEREKHYQLEKFACYEANLTSIPENIDQLKKLKHLDLNSNLIQIVHLDQLNGLDNLNTLDLSSNEIEHIYNHGSMRLPSLTNLHLKYNQLLHFDACGWNMPALFHLDISYNNLTHFAIHHFRALEEVLMSGNPMHCAWKNNLIRDKSGIKIKGVKFCDEQQNFSRNDDRSQATDHSKQQNSSFNSRLGQIEGTKTNIDQQFAEINKRFQKIEAMLENLSGKVIEQQNVSNDIIEAFYRAEIERTAQIKKNP
ncbi:leucine-rich repeat transmembrane neuronal protein 2-like [Aedes albopictus]|uniref:Dynein axonemal assembly factor 1 homolog n=1 Tax=Aedes albopictus TaxID=7160 RepID=A0ABM1ZF42_AEDAL